MPLQLNGKGWCDVHGSHQVGLCLRRTGERLLSHSLSPRREGLERPLWTNGEVGLGSAVCVHGLPMQSFRRIFSRSMLATFERPLPPSLTFLTAGANVKFRSRPVARRENRRWLQWVVRRSWGPWVDLRKAVSERRTKIVRRSLDPQYPFQAF